MPWYEVEDFAKETIDNPNSGNEVGEVSVERVIVHWYK